jgi:hypothetical protein
MEEEARAEAAARAIEFSTFIVITNPSLASFLPFPPLCSPCSLVLCSFEAFCYFLSSPFLVMNKFGKEKRVRLF